MRGPGIGEAYRITAMGPGVTPIVQVTQARLGGFDPGKHVQLQQLFDQILGGDTHCRGER